MTESRAERSPLAPAAKSAASRPTGPARAWISALGLQMTLVVLLQAAYALAVARQLGPLSPGRALLTMALFIPESIGRRLINDYDDYRRGVDRVEDARPGSALALGLPMRQVRLVGLVSFAVAVAVMTYLLYTTSPLSVLILPLAFVTLVYSGGPSPLGHRALGEVIDFLLTGFLVVAAVIWVNVHRLTPGAVLTAVAAGFLFTATMFHNDLRDSADDLRAGKRTLAHALSPRAAKVWYTVFVVAPYPCVLYAAYEFESVRYAAPLLTLPYAAYVVTAVVRSRLGATMPSWLHLPRLLSSFFGLLALAAWI